MWERIAVSSVLMIGAIVLFILFTAVLFILEKRSEDHHINAPTRQRPRKHPCQTVPRTAIHKKAAMIQTRRRVVVRNPNRVA